MKKVLFLAYYYPPCGGAGVQRTVKFVKYLPEFGYTPVVVAGSGFILKRKTFLEQGLWKPGHMTGTTYYFMQMARAGYINGWYYPLIYQEHMDDPKSKYCMIKDAESFAVYKNITFGLKSGSYNDVEGRMKRRNDIVRNLLDDPFEVTYYTGWRKGVRVLRNKLKRILA